MIEIIIDKEEEKKTIGVIENGKLIEVYEENKENKHERNEGNIYVGIVKDIIPGMQAAFIDIGTEKNSFIHVRDIMPQIDEKIERKEEKKIKDLVKPKQKLLVQVQKDSNDKKGARTTTHIKLTGKYVILLPQTTIVTVSQKIQDETEKNRLIKLVKENLQENMGAIIRTVAEKKENEIIIEDLQKLQEQWQDIYQKFKKSDSKSQLLYTSPSIVEKIILDLPSEKIDSIIVNTKEDYSELEQMVSHKIKLALEENKNLIKKYPEFPTAMQAIGYKEIVEYLNNELSLEEATEKIKQENIDKLYGNKLTTSISKLEQYRRCPFSYFLQYGLKIKPQEELKVQSFDTGTFMHETIDEFFSIVKENGYQLSELTEEQISEIIDKIIDEKLLQNKNYIFTSTAKYRALVLRLKRLVKKALKYIVETLTLSEFNVLGTEIEFDEKGKYKPIRITLDNGKNVEIIGKIDRIDTAQNEDGKYLRIIDYKSSIKNIDLNEVYAGLQIQLLTYLDAACKEEDLLPAGILYFNLIEQMVKTEKNIGIEKIEEQIRKGFKMKGLILADIKVVKLHDKNLDSGYSNLVPAYISKKTGDISEGNSSCVSKEEFKDLQDYMYKVIKQISNEILSGKIDLKPFYKNKKTPCSYCDYKSICNFNNGACQNKYNFIDEKSKKEILEKIKQKKSN